MYEAHSFFTKTQEPYSFLLENRAWQAKRLAILARDNNRCQRCGAKESDGVRLHVHHKHYIYGLDPWEYKDPELITYCEKCHSIVHNNCHIPVCRLQGNQLVEVQLTACYRCGGAGWFHQYKHVDNGVCFRCHGAKYEELINVVENYAEEHNINLAELNDGFQPLIPKIQDQGSIIKAIVCKSKKSDNLYLELVWNDGKVDHCCLDYSVNANPGDLLEVSSLRYKKATKKDGQEYVILKGEVCEDGK